MVLNEWMTNTEMQSAEAVPAVTRDEAADLAETEYERLLVLLETLSGEDWEQPTYCDAWNVQQMTAHLAGAVTGWSSLGDLLHQTVRNPYLFQFDEPVDGINKLQVEERAGDPPAELLAEFRRNGPRAITNRHKLPWLLRQIRMPLGVAGVASLAYLVDTIYPRDQWMHRYDLCAATGKPMQLTAEHDGRLVALVMRDVAHKLHRAGWKRLIILRLSGVAGGDYLIGSGAGPDCSITIDPLDFNLRASGRVNVDDVWPRLTITGDTTTAREFLQLCEVLY